MDIMTSPYKNAADSPSRQLLYELSRLGIANQESFYARLDREYKEKEARHLEALADAAAKHDKIRKNAENEREKLELQLQAEQREREEEERKERERIRLEQEKAEKERLIEVAKAAELEERRVAELRRLELEEAELKRAAKERQDAKNARQLKEKQDAEAQEAQEKEKAGQAEKAAKEAAIAAQRLNRPPQLSSTGPTTAPPPIATVPQDPAKEAEHKRYLEIHSSLKDLRKYMIAEAQGNPPFKQQMGDMRREIVKCVGQLIGGRGKNRVPVDASHVGQENLADTTYQLHQLMAVMRLALNFANPQVDITKVLASPPKLAEGQDTKVPAMLIYLMNIFSKAVIAQFINEASVKPEAADPIGTVASHIFSQPDFRWNGISLVDILFAKMHVVCPVLFGIHGDESTREGKIRLGWWQDDKDSSEPSWVPSQNHYERMTGLGAGFASLALRNYEKTKLINPIPNSVYWRALANLVNLSAPHVTQTHYVVLKAMIENHVPRILEFWGDLGGAALRLALIDFPNREQPQSVAAKALSALVDHLRREKNLIL